MAEGARVVVFASQKGGSGKTTLSGHIAVEAERAGDGPVALIDTDPQGSLAKWWNSRAAATPAFAHTPLEELDSCLNRLKGLGYRLIIVDTPPAVTATISHVVARADMVVVPTRPSPHDLRAVGPTVDIAESLKKPLVFVVNSATPRARITSETAVALSQHGMVAPVTLHHRVDFAASMIDGRTVGDIRPDSKSAKEVTSLWLYMRDRLAKVGENGLAWAAGPRTDFSTAVLTPETGSETVMDPMEASDSDGGDDGFDLDMPSWASTAAAMVTNPKRAAPRREPPKPDEEFDAIDAWDGIERRQGNRGSAPGGVERRQPRVFGRRAGQPAPSRSRTRELS